MRAPRTAVLFVLALFVASIAGRDVQAQTEPSSVDDSATVDTGLNEIDEMIVHGRRVGDLEIEIRRAEDALFARFNELNSTDDFDIRCHRERLTTMRNRFCVPVFERKLQGMAARAAAEAMAHNRTSGMGAGWFSAQLARQMRGEMNAEMRELADEDEQLQKAMTDLAAAQFALTLARGQTTLSREVTAASGSLPYGAEYMHEVIMGSKPFVHHLTTRTFTIADVLGEVHRITVECAEGRRRIDYESGVDWTVPNDWTACILQVNAKKETTFRLYEF